MGKVYNKLSCGLEIDNNWYYGDSHYYIIKETDRVGFVAGQVEETARIELSKQDIEDLSKGLIPKKLWNFTMEEVNKNGN